jgi:carbon storage regulator
MLVLSRHRDEEIMIGDHIRIAVVDIRGDKVRLGIIAPAVVSIHRMEVYEAIKREAIKSELANRKEEPQQEELATPGTKQDSPIPSGIHLDGPAS